MSAQPGGRIESHVSIGKVGSGCIAPPVPRCSVFRTGPRMPPPSSSGSHGRSCIRGMRTLWRTLAYGLATVRAMISSQFSLELVHVPEADQDCAAGRVVHLRRVADRPRRVAPPFEPLAAHRELAVDHELLDRPSRL